MIPVPSATQDNGSSALKTGTFNSSSRSSGKLWSKAPPPVKIIPFSIISADNSGGVCSKQL